MEKKYSLSEFGYTAILGKFAEQADGAVWLQQGGTVVLATVVSESSQDFPGFFPLTVDYREQFAAAGRIPGGYLKREGKPSDQEVLHGRLIDRALRPLFPENLFDKVMLNVTVYSADKEHMPHGLALVASSMALMTSSIPFMGPLGICEVARVEGKWVFDPKYSDVTASDVRLIFAGTEEGINMIEGSASELAEADFVDAMFQAHEYIKKQIIWQRGVQADYGTERRQVVDTFGLQAWEARAKSFLTDEIVSTLFVVDKVERSKKRGEIAAAFEAAFATELEASGTSKSIIDYAFDKVLKALLNELVFKRGHRIDLRDFTTVRKISTEVGLLPCNHGSALFTRGRTQALVSVTLGGGQDQMRVDGLMGEKTKPFMLHYNFPSFSVGEARPSRGPGRRDIGHGYLALSAIERMLPDQEKFPYTIRVVSDILESDGSSSMATVCGTTMGLMQAGVPMIKMVGGVAMGLLMSKDAKFHVLTDIAGDEDAFGFMDFKVAGTVDGITAIQMDIKYKGGLSRAIFEQAMEQARQGRIHILGEMQKVMSTPNQKLSELVPQIVSLRIPKDKIGAVIGSGGKVIREIIEQTGTAIDIEDDGLVKIFGHPGPLLDKALALVKMLSGQVEVGSRHVGVIKRIAEFGIFVELAPGQDGLVHVSTIPRAQQNVIMNQFKEGDKVTVDIIDYEKASGRIRLKIVD